MYVFKQGSRFKHILDVFLYPFHMYCTVKLYVLSVVSWCTLSQLTIAQFLKSEAATLDAKKSLAALHIDAKKT